MSAMNAQERKLAEEHLYLVKNIVLGLFHINESVQGLGYDDLYQIGCEALCYAAMNYHDERGAAFTTFASVVIKNRLLSHCRKTVRIQAPLSYLDTPLQGHPELTFADTLTDEAEHTLSDTEVYLLLSETGRKYTGIAQKGIEALKLKCLGYTSAEIAQYYGTKPNHIAAWISRATSKLRSDSLFYYQ